MMFSSSSPKFAGLKNQGATCYMNSVLQSLYHIPKFRKIIYSLSPQNPPETDPEKIIFSLQRLFARLQLASEPASTKGLTKSFGWNSNEVFQMHDAQEFTRKLIDMIESQTIKEQNQKGLNDSVNDIKKLFCGEMVSIWNCPNVDFQKEKKEEFYDLQMVVKDVDSLEQSFANYTEPTLLTGADQYDTGEFGKQDCTIKTKFISFPQVLHIHLRRFQYNPDTNSMEKVNSKFSFPAVLDLSEYIENSDEDWTYTIVGVLVHSGDVGYGHYVAYLKPSQAEGWYKFNDSAVTSCSAVQAMDDNFGGDSIYSFQKSHSSYFLVYVRTLYYQSLFDQNMKMPESVDAYFREKDKKKAEKLKQKNKTELIVFTKDSFAKSAKFCLLEPIYGQLFHCYKTDSFELLREKICPLVDPENCSVYCLGYNQQFSLLSDKHKTVGTFSDNKLYASSSTNPICLFYIFCSVLKSPLRFLGEISLLADSTVKDLIYPYDNQLSGKVFSYNDYLAKALEFHSKVFPSYPYSSQVLPIIVYQTDSQLHCLEKPERKINIIKSGRYSYFDFFLKSSSNYTFTDFLHANKNVKEYCFVYYGTQEVKKLYCPENPEKEMLSKFLCDSFQIPFDPERQAVSIYQLLYEKSIVDGIPPDNKKTLVFQLHLQNDSFLYSQSKLRHLFIIKKENNAFRIVEKKYILTPEEIDQISKITPQLGLGDDDVFIYSLEKDEKVPIEIKSLKSNIYLYLQVNPYKNSPSYSNSSYPDVKKVPVDVSAISSDGAFPFFVKVKLGEPYDSFCKRVKKFIPHRNDCALRIFSHFSKSSRASLSTGSIPWETKEKLPHYFSLSFLQKSTYDSSVSSPTTIQGLHLQ